MGRPITIGADEALTLRLPSELADAIDAAAQAAGVTRSEWLRATLEHATRRRRAA